MHPRLAQFGSLVIPTYSVVAAVGLICALVLAEWCGPRAGIARDRIWNLCLAMLLGTVVLSRLVLVMELFPAFRSYPRLVLFLPTLTKFGPAIALVCFAACVGATRMPWLRTLDAMGAPALFLLAALHVGSFFAGNDLGSTTALSIGNLVPGDEGHHPVALYAAAFTLIACAGSLFTLLRQHRPGRAFGVALAGGAVARYLADEFRPGYLLTDLRLPGFLRVDQIVLIALTIAGMLLLLTPKVRHAK